MASVSIYRSRQAKQYDLLLKDLTTREPFVDQVATDGEEYGVLGDINDPRPGQSEREVFVVATRGRGANFVEKQSSQLLVGDVRNTLSNLTWPQIRPRELLGYADQEDTEDRLYRLEGPYFDGDEVRLDAYKLVDEYECYE